MVDKYLIRVHTMASNIGVYCRDYLWSMQQMSKYPHKMQMVITCYTQKQSFKWVHATHNNPVEWKRPLKQLSWFPFVRSVEIWNTNGFQSLTQLIIEKWFLDEFILKIKFYVKKSKKRKNFNIPWPVIKLFLYY